MEAQRRQQADDTVRHPFARLDQTLVLTGLRVGKDVDTAGRAIEKPLPVQADEVFAWQAIRHRSRG